MLGLIDRLPRDTNYRQAVSLDKEMAEAYMQLPEAEEEQEYRPSMSEDSALAIGLRDIGNQIRMMRLEAIRISGNNPGNIPMLQGPKTVFEKAAFTRRQREHYALTARLLPHKAEEMQAKIDELQ